MTNRRYQSLAPSVMLAMALVGCTDHKVDSGPINPSSSGAATSEPATDQWLGQWTGPEGTFLRLEGGKGSYKVTVQNLDGPRAFQGSAVGAQIQFERDGVTESIRATNGAETGMKWLVDKKNCLTVRPGEGYCRD